MDNSNSVLAMAMMVQLLCDKVICEHSFFPKGMLSCSSLSHLSVMPGAPMKQHLSEVFVTFVII